MRFIFKVENDEFIQIQVISPFLREEGGTENEQGKKSCSERIFFKCKIRGKVLVLLPKDVAQMWSIALESCHNVG